VSPLRAALAPVLVDLAAVAGGCGVGALTYAVLAGRGDAEEAWAELGWAIAALAAGALIALVVLVVGMVVAARRLLPPGRRALPVAAGLLSPLVASFATSAAESLAPGYGGGGSPWAWAAGAVLTAASAGLAPAAFARAVQDPAARRRTAVALLALFAAGAALTAVAAVDGLDVG